MFDFSALAGSFGNSMNSLTNWLGDQKNLTNFTTVADAIGAAGGSPFAGVGSMMNQSKLANQARLDQNAQTQALLDAFGIAGGQPAAPSPQGMSMGAPAAAVQPAPQAPQVQGKTASPQSIAGELAGVPLTPVEMDGVSSYTVKPGKEGVGREISMKITDGGKKKGSSLSMADMTSRPF